MMTRYERPLTKREATTLRRKITIRNLSSIRMYKRAPFFLIAVFGALWGWTILASNISWQLVTIFWLVLGIGTSLWALLSVQREDRRQIQLLNSALSLNLAAIARIQSTEMVELEEFEDEGACYAFQIDERRVLILHGQDYYATVSFPSSDFELITIRAEGDRIAERHIHALGTKLEPSRVVSAKAKEKLCDLNDMEVLHGRLEDLERLIGIGNPI